MKVSVCEEVSQRGRWYISTLGAQKEPYRVCVVCLLDKERGVRKVVRRFNDINSAGKCRQKGNAEVQIKCEEYLGRKRSRINEKVDEKCSA